MKALKKYQALIFRAEFEEEVSKITGIAPLTLRNYIWTDKIPKKHKETIESILHRRYKFDQTLREMSVNFYKR